MTNLSPAAFRDLNFLMATLYPSVDESRLIIDLAGLQAVRIELAGSALTIWYNILDHARNRDKLGDVIDAALEDVPGHDGLLKAKAGVPPHATEGPEPTEWRGAGDPGNLEKIIGEKSTLVHVRYLELGVEMAKSVARIELAEGFGTGFLVNDNILVTNNHVLPNVGTASAAKVLFNYQKSISGVDARLEEQTLKPDEFFKTSADHDWTLVKVGGDPVSRWGALELSKSDPKEGDRVNIIQHPGGQQKQISLSANVIVFVDDTRVQYLTDTMPGSSGSPVFDENWNVVALHHSGGWLVEPNAASKSTYYRNQGISIKQVLAGLT